MNKKMIAVIDYGMGNLRSVSKALETVGAGVCVTSDKEKIKNADALILPGVGAFTQAMDNLKELDLVTIICESIKENKPFLGICLGMQLLFAKSEEGKKPKGLNIFNGEVKRFKQGLKVPHMGWNKIKIENKCRIFERIPDESYFYFVHSYFGIPGDKGIIAATTSYGEEFVSAISSGNIYATQFHPEKSHDLGLKILENFYKLC